MAQLKITTASFNLSSSWRCALDTEGSLAGINWSIVEGPTTDSRDVTFDWSDDGITITSAKIHATLGSPLTGAAIRTVNGAPFDSDGFASVPIDSNATTLVATFKFKANGAPYMDANLHTASLSFDDVYLLIEYELDYTPPKLVDYTDSDLVKGETYVKAVHMTELHTNVNLIRVARKLAEYAFTSIVAMETSLAGWNDHVLEIRSALDEMNIIYEDWIELDVNRPRLSVLLQLRRVTQKMLKENPISSMNPSVLIDGYTGLTYELSVVDGKLTMTEIESSNPSPFRILTDTVTSTTYKISVVDGDLTMSEFESDILHSIDNFTDSVTSTVYKLEVVNGDLTMSEA